LIVIRVKKQKRDLAVGSDFCIAGLWSFEGPVANVVGEEDAA